MAERIIARVDGSAPATGDTDKGRGYGPVGKSNSVAIGIAGVVSTIAVAILFANGIILDPTLISGATAALALVLGILFTYVTPSKKVIEVIEVTTNRDIDGDAVVGASTIPVEPATDKTV